jgi:3-oxoacyl-[acyl-carrier protein] reductase
MDLQLAGKKALVTGSTKGLGRAIAETFLDEGMAVAICARYGRRLSSKRSRSCRRVEPLSAPRSTPPTLRRCAGSWPQSIEQLGGLDVYVHNTSGKPGKTIEAWQNNMDIDLMALINGVEERRRH